MKTRDMYLTEEEARAKWCPMARVAVQTGRGPVTVNDPAMDIPYGHSGRCVASGCMMWRAISLPDNTRPQPVMRGYCGLAPMPSGMADAQVTINGEATLTGVLQKDVLRGLGVGDHGP